MRLSEQLICKMLDHWAMGAGPVTCKTLNLQNVRLQGQALVVMRHSERPICKMLDYCAMGAGPVVTCKTLNLQNVTLQGQALVVMSHSEQVLFAKH